MEDLKKEIEIDEHKIPITDLYYRLQTNPETGLTSDEAKYKRNIPIIIIYFCFNRFRLARDGPNALVPPKTTPEWVKFCKQLFGGFCLMLWIGAFLCFFAYGIQSGSNDEHTKDNVNFHLEFFIFLLYNEYSLSALLGFSVGSCCYHYRLFFLLSRSQIFQNNGIFQ